MHCLVFQTKASHATYRKGDLMSTACWWVLDAGCWILDAGCWCWIL